MDRLAVGTLLDERFEVTRFLGAGAFGQVYEAKQRILDMPVRHVALKLFKSDLVTRANVASVLTDVLMLVRLLDEEPPEAVSRRIVQIYDVGIVHTGVGEQVYMSMQLIKGRRTLDNEIRRHREGGMPVALSLQYLERLLIPLAWMHEQGLVHGDLKPDNVLVTADQDIVLTDFGLAARRHLGTQGGALVWSAPESLTGVGGDVQSDIYSVGLIWYALLTGKTLYSQVGLAALGAGEDQQYKEEQLRARKWSWAQPGAHATSDAQLPSPIDRNAELAEHPLLVALLQRCLSFRIAERCPHAGMVLETIQGYAKTGKVPSWITAETADSANLPNTSNALAVQSGTEDSLGDKIADIQRLHGTGQTQPALQQAGALFKRYPTEHRVASLMATLYEQAGQITLANRLHKTAAKLQAQS